ncbi:MAG: hypothetical protein ACRDQ5_03305 [Sciscionella sp.]
MGTQRPCGQHEIALDALRQYLDRRSTLREQHLARFLDEDAELLDRLAR